MKQGLLSVFLLCAVFVLGVTPAYAQQDPLTIDVPALRLPDEIRAEFIAEKMAINGLPMSIQVFHSQMSADEVINQFERQWRSHVGVTTRRERNEDGKGIVMSKDGFFHRVVAKDTADGTEGAITTSPLPSNHKPDYKTEFPLPRQAAVVSKVESLDDGVRSETLTLANNNSIEANVADFKLALAAKGWREDAFQSQMTTPGRAQLIFQNNKQFAQITIVDARAPTGHSTTILITWTK